MRTHVLVLGVLALCLTACVVLPPSAKPGWALTVVRTEDWRGLYGGDVWRYDIASGRAEPLTEGDALRWGTTQVPANEWQWLRCCAPTVSPDGAWLAYSPHSGYWSPGGEDTPLVNVPPYMIVQPVDVSSPPQTIEGTVRAVWSPDSQRLAYTVGLNTPWAEAGDPSLYVYDLSSQSATPLLPGDPTMRALGALVWSPDGRSLAYVARVQSQDERDGGTLEAQRLDLDTGTVEVVAPVEVRLGSAPRLCWTADGQVVVGRQPPGVTRCSDPARSEEPGCVWTRCTAPDGTRVAQVTPMAEAESSRVTVEGAGGVLWERELAGVVADRVAWSADGSVLLLTSGAGETYAEPWRTWRLPADGSGEVELAIEGQIISIVPQR